jgi:hypothetical protein
MAAQTLTLGGKRYVILPEKEYRALRNGSKRSNSTGAKREPRMTAQDRGDVAEAKRRLADPNLKLIPLSQLKRELDL